MQHKQPRQLPLGSDRLICLLERVVPVLFEVADHCAVPVDASDAPEDTEGKEPVPHVRVNENDHNTDKQGN